MKTRIIALFAGLLAVLPMTSAWAGGGSTSYTYYATLKVGTSSNSPTGAGTVYASKDSTASSGNESVEVSASSSSSSTTLKAYGFAKVNSGFQFDGWSENADGSGTLTAGTKYAYSVSSSSKSSPGPTKSVYAVFSKIVLPEFSVTCANGNYTVNGGAPGTLTQTEAVTVTLASADPNFFCWKIGDKSFTDNPHVQTFSSATTISAQFLTSDAIAEVSTQEGLKAALANDKYLKVIVPAGLSFTIAKGDALTVPAGKALVLDGTLVVLGTFTNNGMLSGSGKVLKVSYVISQGDVIKLYDGNGEECGNMDLKSFKPHYRPTTVTANAPSVTMGSNIGCGESWAVTFGGNAYTISKQSPKALKVTFDTSIAANHIKSIADNADVDSVGDNDCLLLADCSVSGYLDSKNRAVYTKTIDCAGKKATMSGNGGKIAASNALFLNGTVSISPSSENQNSKATFINCTSVTLSKIKGVSPAYGFYACGTKESPLTLSFGYYNSTRGENYRTAYFHNGYYKYTFNSTDDGGGKCVVKGGNFRGSDPTAYIPSALNDVIWAPEDKTANYFVVQPKAAAEKFVSMNGVEYESLEKALEDAPDNTKTTIELIAGLDLTGSTVTIGANKNIYLRLDKHLIEGAGTIVNNGILTVTDSAANECTVACAFENHGTLHFIFGKYTGDIVNKDGALTVHNGVFTGSLTREAGAVNLKGGCFANDVSSFVTADGYRIYSNGSQAYCVCEMPDGTLYDLTVKGVRGYGATPYGLSPSGGHSADYDILAKYAKDSKKAESDYAVADWPRLAELVTFYDIFSGKGLDATLVFDRFVRKGSLTVNVKSGSDEMACDLYLDVPADTPYRGLTEFLMRAPLGPYSSKTYRGVFAEEIKSVGMSVVDESDGANAGTVCTVEVELWVSERGPHYSSTGEKVTNTVCVIGSRRFTIGAGSNVAMIRPETGAATFYPTLKAACEAAKNGETVMLCNDCAICDPISEPCSFRFDANGFVLPDGAIAAGAGLELDVNGGVYTVSKPAVVVRSEDGESEVAAVQETEKVTAEAERRAKENGTTADEETQKILQETNEETGLKVWQEVVLESAGVAVDANTKVVEMEKSAAADATANTITLKTDADVAANANAKSVVRGICLAKVEVAQDGEKTLRAVEATVQKRQESTVNLAELESGVYRPTLIVNDAAGNPQAIPDTKTGEIVVMKTETKQDEPVVIVAVGNESVGGAEVKIDTLVDSSTLAKGDNIRFWNQEKNEYEAWTYGADGMWVANGMNTDLGTSESRSASEVSVPAGAALWFTRSSDSEKAGQSVAVVAKQPEKLETRIKASDNGKSNNWNLIANPNPNHSFALSEINVDEISPNDQIVITQEDGDARTYTCDASGHWGYSEVKVSEVTIGGRKRQVKSVTRKTDDATISAGQGVWYISTDKKAPVFNWEGKGAK